MIRHSQGGATPDKSKMNTEINLKFDKFQTFACKVQQNMRNSEFCDVTLVCADNMKFDAHKVILSAYSPVFKNMLTSEKHQHPLVFMTGVGQEVMGAVLNFMYCGEAQIKYEHINLFIKLSMDLELSGVTAETFSEITLNENKKKTEETKACKYWNKGFCKNKNGNGGKCLDKL